MANNNIGQDVQELLKGKYGTLILILVILVLIWLFIRIMPFLVSAALVIIAAFLVFRFLGKK